MSQTSSLQRSLGPQSHSRAGAGHVFSGQVGCERTGFVLPGSSSCTAAKLWRSVRAARQAIATWRPLPDDPPTIVHATPHAGDERKG